MSDTPGASAPVPTPPGTPTATVLPPENRTRGTIFALGILPAGVIAWVLVAAIGFISGIVGLGIAVGGLALYRFGSGGRVGFTGAARVSAIVIVTLIVSFIASIVVPNSAAFARAAGSGKFFSELVYVIQLGGGDLLFNLVLVLVFAVLGVVTVYRVAMTQAAQDRANPAAANPIDPTPTPPV